MNKIWLFVLILCSIILYVTYSKGYIRIPQIETTNLADILKNPENYLNKTITISGTYTMNLGGDELLIDNQGYKIKIDCKEEGRIFILGNKYEATGTLKFFEKCYCQERYVMNITEEEWEEFVKEIKSTYGISVSKENISSWNPNYLFLPSKEEGWLPVYTLDKVNKSDCTKSSFILRDYHFQIVLNRTHAIDTTTEIIKEGRCKPNSIERVYYFKCTEPMRKI